MKYFITTTILFLNLSIVFSQTNSEPVFLETKSKANLYYVELNGSDGKVYEMGSYFDKAGSGYSIRRTDSIIRQPDGTYLGNSTKIISENKRTYLLVQNKKLTKLNLGSITNTKNVHTNLNNAYYLDHFFSMCDELNKAYPLNHYSFRNGFYSWNELSNKEINHSQFQVYANHKLKAIKDSICVSQNYYVALSSWLTENIKAITYSTLKDSVRKLPSGSKSSSRYFTNVINEISKQNPEYFFMLAEDLPDERDVIFAAAETSKGVLRNLKAIEGHSEVKKEFFKARKFNKTMPYKIIGLYAVVAGLITFLIVQQ